MRKKLITNIMSLVILSSSLAIAHGEDKPGPNGGFIRMPGAFHTELVAESANSVKVFLLDLEWKNPSVNKSDVQITHNNSKTKAKCKIKENFYICVFPKSVNLKKKGSLKVNSTREGQTGNEVSYPLPLKLEVVDDGHGGRH